MDEEKLKETLADETLAQDCGLKRALEMVALLEAQLKEMNPNLDSISEYDSSSHRRFEIHFMCNINFMVLNPAANVLDIGAKFACIMTEWRILTPLLNSEMT